MTLGELITGLNENKQVKVVDHITAEELARYDGRDSIPEELNECEVISWLSFDNRMYIIAIRR